MRFHQSDIEISIPAPAVEFAIQHSEGLPSEPLPSPYFPLCFSLESSYNSPRSTRRISAGESPMSVISIPHPLGRVYDFPEDSKKKLNYNDTFYCETCHKTLKQKSYKAHLLTKLHQSHLKIDN